MAHDIEITRGRNLTLKVYVATKDGAYTLASGEQLVFGVKKRFWHDELLICKTVTSGTNGVYEINLTPADTEQLELGKYFYDVGLQNGSNYYEIIKTSAFKLTGDVTNWLRDG
jgi:hypothetical protein